MLPFPSANIKSTIPNEKTTRRKYSISLTSSTPIFSAFFCIDLRLLFVYLASDLRRASYEGSLLIQTTNYCRNYLHRVWRLVVHSTGGGSLSCSVPQNVGWRLCITWGCGTHESSWTVLTGPWDQRCNYDDGVLGKSDHPRICR